MEHTAPIQSYTFAYPTRVVGGGELLFIRLAIHLASKGHRVNIIDYADGYIAKEACGHENINHVVYADDAVEVPENTLLMLPPLLHVSVSRWKVPHSSKVMLMCWDKLQFLLRFGPLNFTPPLDFKKLRNEALEMNQTKYNAFKKAVETMATHNGVIFLEPYAKNGTADLFDVAFNDAYSWMTPTPCTPSPMPALVERWNTRHEKTGLHLGWLGRLSFEKISCLQYVIHNAGVYATDENPITLHVIGEGDHKRKLQAWIEQQNFTNALEIRWVGTLTGHALDYYMKSSMDACFSHGTSLLESAKLKLPSIITDSSLTDIPLDTRLAYLHESDFGLLGEFVNSTVTPRQHTFADIIKDISVQKEVLGEKDFDYWQNNHAIEVTAKKIVEQANRCTYSGDIYEQCNTYLVQEGRMAVAGK